MAVFGHRDHRRLLALIGLRGVSGGDRLAPHSTTTGQSLVASIAIAFQNPRVGLGCVIRIINTAPQFGFLVFLPTIFSDDLGFGTSGWLRLVFIVGASNIFANLIFGIVSDKIGWHRTLRIFGCLGCAVSSLLLYFLPQTFGATGWPRCAPRCSASPWPGSPPSRC